VEVGAGAGVVWAGVVLVEVEAGGAGVVDGAVAPPGLAVLPPGAAVVVGVGAGSVAGVVVAGASTLCVRSGVEVVRALGESAGELPPQPTAVSARVPASRSAGSPPPRRREGWVVRVMRSGTRPRLATALRRCLSSAVFLG
jgi:hypothetical protein